jgi:hypothetical protein
MNPGFGLAFDSSDLLFNFPVKTDSRLEYEFLLWSTDKLLRGIGWVGKNLSLAMIKLMNSKVR